MSSDIPQSSGIYRITCTSTGKFYIGSSANLHRRCREHFSNLRKKTHCNKKLQNAFDKYGADTFTFDVIELVLTPEFLTVREQFWLDKLRPHFNLAPVAGSLLGMERTPEHTEKIRRALTGRPSPMKGIERTPETIEKIKLTKQARSIPITDRERPCEVCETLFFSRKHPRRKFCSRACANKSKEKQIQRTCVICGLIFERQSAKISDYCSAECSYQGQRKDIAEAFWAKVDKSNDCWLWTAAKDAHGYGLFTMGAHGRTIGAHRFAYEQFLGAIPRNLTVCHRCDTPACVRPDHLFLRSRADNNLDKISKGRQPRGEAISNSKLTENDIRAIRASDGGRGKNKELAKLYGIDCRTVWAIRSGKTWKHVI